MKALLTPLVLMATSVAIGAGVPQGLLVDGKVRVKDHSMEGARVVVERNGIQVQVLQHEIEHFTLELNLQQDYVLYFFQEGCLSKSLHFDTRMPEMAEASAPYRFPFLVTLEPKPKGPVVGYAKAVGTVVFDVAKGDFDYSTNYALARENANRQKAKNTSSGHLELSIALQADEPSVAVPKQEVASPVAPDRSTWSPGLSTTRMPPEKPMVLQRSRSFQAVVPDTPRPDGREEEVEVRPGYVARVLRITEQGHTREFRKVTHRYGEVNWFCNGASCSELQYNALVER